MQMKKYKCHILAAIIGAMTAVLVYYIITGNHSLKSQVQSLKKERKELLSQVNNNKNLIEQLKSLDETENHMDEVIVFIGLKQKYSLNAAEKEEMITLKTRIGHDPDINHSHKCIKEVLTIMKHYIYECTKLIDEDEGNVNKSDQLFENFANEIDQLQRNKDKNTAVGSGLWTRFTTALYNWSMWLLNTVKNLLIM